MPFKYKTTSPNSTITSDERQYPDGLTKREYFAAVCMSAYVSGNSHLSNFDRNAEKAVLAADALIMALNASNVEYESEFPTA